MTATMQVTVDAVSPYGEFMTLSGGPSYRVILSWQDAERAARDWMRYWGFRDAQVTGPGADGGVDVASQGALAQVKFQVQTVGAPAVQQLVGARGRAVEKQLVFFSSSGYSAKAVSYASGMDVALFTYDAGTGMPTPVSPAAHRLTREHPAPPPPVQRATTQPPPGTPGVTDWAEARATLAEARSMARGVPAGVAAALLLALPGTLLLVAVAAADARGESSEGIDMIGAIGVLAVIIGLVLTRSATGRLRREGRRGAATLASAVVVAPAVAMWATLAHRFTTDPDHPASSAVFAAVAALTLLVLVAGVSPPDRASSPPS